MKRITQSQNLAGRRRLAVAVAAAITLAALTIAPAAAQTYTTLHNFTEGQDGGYPYAGITVGPNGDLYGAVEAAGQYDRGLIYRMHHAAGGWVFLPLYSFQLAPDGDDPVARVVFGPDGLLYGTTYDGGANNGGTVFRLQPPPSVCKSVSCPWSETVLYSFTGTHDGRSPTYGDLTFDHAGNIYGTAQYGGEAGHGVVFELSPSGGGWTESVLWNFGTGSDGGQPISGVIFDSAGNLYGTTSAFGSNALGTVYELSPTQSGWTATTLYSFTSADNGNGAGGLVMDSQGNLYGYTGYRNPGAAYELSPQNGGWTYTRLQVFMGVATVGPIAAPTFDAQGNVYGPLPWSGVNQQGEIFELSSSGGQWTYSPFFQFGGMDGVYPYGTVAFDSAGNMYGTTYQGGTLGYGTVWEITP